MNERRRTVSLRANGSRECAPDDRLREAIQKCSKELDCFVAEFIIGPAEGRTRWLLAMTTEGAGFGESDESDRPRRVERRRQDDAAGAYHPAFSEERPSRLRHQACPPQFRCRRAGQGFLGAPA